MLRFPDGHRCLLPQDSRGAAESSPNFRSSALWASELSPARGPASPAGSVGSASPASHVAPADLREVASNLQRLSQGHEALWQEFQQLKREAKNQNEGVEQLKRQSQAGSFQDVGDFHQAGDPRAGAAGGAGAGVAAAGAPRGDTLPRAQQRDARTGVGRTGAANGKNESGEERQRPEPKRWDESVADCLLCGK